MAFHSILVEQPEAGSASDAREAPEYFGDLHLDQIVAAITAGRDEYDLTPFFQAPLRRLETIAYRHEILRDLEDSALAQSIESFARRLRAMRTHLAQAEKLYYARQKQRSFLEAVDIYCEAVQLLASDLSQARVQSQGFVGLRDYVTEYIRSDRFISVLSETRKLKADLTAIRYRLQIDGGRITVSAYESEPDYGAEVLQTFAKFKQGEPKEYDFKVHSAIQMNHVEAAILDLVAKLHPDTFGTLERYPERHRDYLDETIGRFDREVQFYVAWLAHVAKLRRAGLSVCYPEVSDSSKEVFGQDVFDLALAARLIAEGRQVVSNEFYLEGPQRIFIVTGANQGGKTTFARTFGQLHYLAALGCQVPGRKAKLFVFDEIFTHFEREEDLENPSGKLESDLGRLHAILERATPRSILIMNETLSSTTVMDALLLSKQLLKQIVERDMLCVFVTFLDELASFGASTVSMVSSVDPQNPARRTFKVLRRPPDGLAHAVTLAGQYGLTYEKIRERLLG